MIYLISTIIALVLIVVYSISDMNRNKEELQAKKNSAALNGWHHIINKGDKNV